MDKRCCSECEAEFEPYQWNQKRCYDCIEKSDPRFKGRPQRNCLYCEEVFQPRVIRQMCCSTACRDKHRTATYYQREYGLTEEQRKTMLDDANHNCEICGSEGFLMNGQRHKAKLVIDHCHSSGDVRGILCHNCNRALGLLQDSLENLEQAIQYLKRSGQ